jgi:hypothetical protein
MDCRTIRYGRNSMIKIIFATALLLTLAVAVEASDVVGIFAYEIAIPTGETRTFIDKTSWRGFNLEFRSLMENSLSWGLSFNWNILYETTDQLIELEDGHLSGHQDRRVYSVPISAGLHYYFEDPRYSEQISPYVGINGGAYRIEQVLNVGVYSIIDDNWHFGFAPEAGVVFPVSYTAQIIGRAKYHYAFKSGDSINYSYWSFSVGLFHH